MTTLFPFVSDLHFNSLLGLCTPVVRVANKDSYRATKGQLALWGSWKEFWDIVGEKKVEVDGECIGVVAGDLNDLNVHNGTELISRAEGDIIRGTVGVLQPMLDVVDRIALMRGTQALSLIHI